MEEKLVACQGVGAKDVAVPAIDTHGQSGAGQGTGLLHGMETDIRTPANQRQPELSGQGFQAGGCRAAWVRMGQGWRRSGATAERMNGVR